MGGRESAAGASTPWRSDHWTPDCWGVERCRRACGNTRASAQSLLGLSHSSPKRCNPRTSALVNCCNQVSLSFSKLWRAQERSALDATRGGLHIRPRKDHGHLILRRGICSFPARPQARPSDRTRLACQADDSHTAMTELLADRIPVEVSRLPRGLSHLRQDRPDPGRNTSA
jgi:hypothetical protein